MSKREPRLQFSDEDRASPELQKPIRRAEKAAGKADAAQARIPKKTVKKKETVTDPATGKKTVHLRFEEMDQKKPPSRLTHAVRDAPANTVTGRIHQSIRESEQDNVGVESAHKSEEAAETAGRLVREGYRSHKLKPYRDAAKAEHRLEKANVDFLYQKSLQENPQLASNPFSRWQQKQAIKKQYAAARRSGQAAGTAANAAETAASGAKKAAEQTKKAGEFFWRHRWILEQLVACGAPESILTDAKPHVGTDMLHVTLVNLRRQLLSLGAQVRFGHRVTGLRVRDGALEGLEVTGPEGPYVLPARHAVLALGHSARDTFEMLHAAGVQMEQKPFAVGVRIEHRQSDMDAAQYRQFAGHPCLPAASYKLSCHLENGRSAFSFCVCPGGQVVAAASERGRVVTNGMSAYARDRENINGGLLVNVTPEDFGSGHPLAGVAFQRQLEEAAFRLGGGGYAAPCQRVEDFLAGRPSVGPGRVIPSYRPGVRWTDLRQCLPEFVWETLALALPVLDRKIQGYAQGDAVLTAVETRSSSPVRILRDESGQCSVRGLYPCGEGAGYAGGILSAAADGMRCAEKIWEVYSG